MKKLFKNSWFQNGLLLAALGVLYLTGYHTEALGFLQRGVLMTGLLNPDIKEQAAPEGDLYLDAAAYGLELTDPDGNRISLSDLQGQVIFLNLWATWCPPCLAEMPGIDRLYDKVGDRVAFVLVSRDQDFEVARNFMTRKGYQAPYYEANGPLPHAFRSGGIPATFVIGRDGRLAYAHTGMADYDHPEIEAFLLALSGDNEQGR